MKFDNELYEIRKVTFNAITYETFETTSIATELDVVTTRHDMIHAIDEFSNEF